MERFPKKEKAQFEQLTSDNQLPDIDLEEMLNEFKNGKEITALRKM